MCKVPLLMLSERPAGAKVWVIPECWEGRLIIGFKGKIAVGTLVEHSTRYTLSLNSPIGHAAAAEIQDTVISKLASLLDSLHLSLTWEQGNKLV